MWSQTGGVCTQVHSHCCGSPQCRAGRSGLRRQGRGFQMSPILCSPTSQIVFWFAECNKILPMKKTSFNLPSSKVSGKNFCCYYLNNSINLKTSKLFVLFWQKLKHLFFFFGGGEGNSKIQGFLRKQHASYLEQVARAVSPPTNRHDDFMFPETSLFVQAAPWWGLNPLGSRTVFKDYTVCRCLWNIFCFAHKQNIYRLSPVVLTVSPQIRV